MLALPTEDSQDVKLESVVCAICNSSSSRLIGQGKDREYQTVNNVFQVVECNCCGLRYLNPRPTVEELGRIYPSNYHAYNIRSRGESMEVLSWVTRLRHRIYSRRFSNVFSELDGAAEIRLLDVGCGDGWMLDLYRLAAPNPLLTYGVDFNAEVCQIAESFGHKVFCGRFEDLSLDGQFDIINLSHVIEHVSDPASIASKSFSLLRPGGLFVVETPNWRTWEGILLEKGDWGAYHIPRHWNLFDATTLQRLGEQAGLKLVRVIYNPAPVHWIWSFNNISIRKGGPLGRLGGQIFSPLSGFGGGLKAFLMLSIFTLFDLTLKLFTGRTSNMMMIFRKV